MATSDKLKRHEVLSNAVTHPFGIVSIVFSEAWNYISCSIFIAQDILILEAMQKTGCRFKKITTCPSFKSFKKVRSECGDSYFPGTLVGKKPNLAEFQAVAGFPE